MAEHDAGGSIRLAQRCEPRKHIVERVGSDARQLLGEQRDDDLQRRNRLRGGCDVAGAARQRLGVQIHVSVSVVGLSHPTVERPAGRAQARAGGAAPRWSAGEVPAESLLAPEDAQLLRDAIAAGRAPAPEGVAA